MDVVLNMTPALFWTAGDGIFSRLIERVSLRSAGIRTLGPYLAVPSHVGLCMLWDGDGEEDVVRADFVPMAAALDPEGEFRSRQAFTRMGWEAHHDTGGWRRCDVTGSYLIEKPSGTIQASRLAYISPLYEIGPADLQGFVHWCDHQIPLWDYHDQQLVRLWGKATFGLPLPRDSGRVVCSEAAARATMQWVNWNGNKGFDRLTPLDLLLIREQEKPLSVLANLAWIP